MAGTKIKMVGIREDDFCAKFFERFIPQALYGGLRAHGQEKWSFDGAVGRGQAAAARAAGIGVCYCKGKNHFDQRQEKRIGKNACPTSGYQEKMNVAPTRTASYPAQTM